MSTEAAPAPIDRWTVVAIAIVVYGLANVVHEGLGHGGTCIILGGKPQLWNAVYFESDTGGLGDTAERWIAAGGTLSNFLVAALAALAIGSRAVRSAAGRYFLALLLAVNLLQATGYWLFSGVGGIGDWARVVSGWPHQGLWRLALAAAGAIGYWLSIRISLRALEPFLGSGPDREARGRALTVPAYLAGGLLYVAAGIFNPLGWKLVLISAVAASFGGTSAFAWMASLLAQRRLFPPSGAPARGIPRSLGWIVAAALVAALFIAVLGPGVRFAAGEAGGR
jgi:hypothetical protein